MTTATTPTLAEAFGRLKEIGISKAFARRALPSWWDDDIALAPSGLQQAQLYFSRTFNLDMHSWGNLTKPLQHLKVERKFKLSKNIAESDPAIALSANYLNAIAKMVLHNTHKTQTVVPRKAEELRNQIVKNAGVVSLKSLLDWCYQASIPVMHVEELPAKKMTAMVTRFDNRYAIILSKKAHGAYLLFHLAHELGHIGCQHLHANGFVADSEINSSDKNDHDEREADSFALTLLNGKNVSYPSNPYLRNGKSLFLAATKTSVQECIDVGHIILNYAHHRKAAFALANAALQYLPHELSGGSIVNHAFFEHLNKDHFSEAQMEWLVQACRIS